MARTEHTLTNSKYARAQLVKFANSLSAWRATAKLTRLALAKRAGCSENQIANIEKKRCCPSFAVYTALCREMGLEPVPDFPLEV